MELVSLACLHNSTQKNTFSVIIRQDTQVYTHIHVGTNANTHLKVEQSIQLVLNNGQSFDQLLCIHGAHHSINTAQCTNTYEQKTKTNKRTETNTANNQRS